MLRKFAEILADELKIAVDAVRQSRDQVELFGLEAGVLAQQKPRALGGKVAEQRLRFIDPQFLEVFSGTEGVPG